jgi:uncharacterized membrane protein
MTPSPRTPLVVVLVAAILGLTFAGLSSYDSIRHLDRQLHEVHCSFVPGLVGAGGDNPCRTAMYSSYSAFFRGTFWGGIPIAVLALGTYGFFLAFAAALLVGGAAVGRGAYRFLALASLLPVATTLVMGFIAAFKLGSFCRTCVGLYVSSILLCVGAFLALRAAGRAAAAAPGTGAWEASGEGGRRAGGGPGPLLAWVAAFGAAVLLPAVVYAVAVPDYRARLEGCGTLPQPRDAAKALLRLRTAAPKRPATLFIDPLCPTCRALHDRLESEGALERLDLRVALLPLDSDCNWMVDRAVHPGACVLARAVICEEDRAREALEWMYQHQDELGRLGKAGSRPLRARLRERFGAGLEACLDARKTTVRLNNVLQYAVSNHVPVSTPQLYLGARRVCDEDTDLGLRYTLRHLAPEVLE